MVNLLQILWTGERTARRKRALREPQEGGGRRQRDAKLLQKVH